MVKPLKQQLRFKNYKKDRILERLSYLISQNSFIILNIEEINNIEEIVSFYICPRTFKVPILKDLKTVEMFKIGNKQMFRTKVVDSPVTGRKTLKVTFNE